MTEKVEENQIKELIPGSYFTTTGSSKENYINNVFGEDTNSQWISREPIGAPEGGVDQFIRIDLKEKQRFNQIIIKKICNVNGPLRIYASDRLTKNVEDFISYKMKFYSTTFSSRQVAPAQPRSYECVAEIPTVKQTDTKDMKIKFDFVTVEKRYIYIVFEGFKTNSNTKYIQIGDITINYVDSNLYQLKKADTKKIKTPVFDIFDFGAAGDGETEDTAAIQQAVNTAHKRGKGTVWLHSGVFVTGSICLKSNVHLHIDASATVLAAVNSKSDKDPVQEYLEKFPTSHRSVFYAENAENITVEGRGTIHGNHYSPLFKGGHRSRKVPSTPNLLCFVGCNNIIIKDIILKNAVSWVQSYCYVENLLIENIIVDSVGTMCSDGLDVTDSHNITIKDCYILSDDDSIALKSKSDFCDKADCQSGVSNVTIENNVVKSFRNSGVMIGTETGWPFKNITVKNNIITGASKYGGLGVAAVDGSDIENVKFENIFVKAEVPLYIRLGNRNRYDRDKIGSIKNVEYKNIHATAGASTGCYITGMKNHLIKDVKFSEMWLEMPGGLNSMPDSPEESSLTTGEAKDHAGKGFEYATATALGTLPASGFYVCHAEDILFENVNLRHRNQDIRDWLVIDDEVINLEVVDCKNYGQKPFNNYAYNPFPVNSNQTNLIDNIYIYDEMINSAVWSVQSDLQVHDRLYGDGQFIISYLPKSLAGADWIRPALSSSYYTADKLIDFSIKEDLTLYVATLDTPYTIEPDWLNDWKEVDKNIMVNRGGSSSLYKFNLYCKNYQEGTKVSLGSNESPNYNEKISCLAPGGHRGTFRQRQEIVYPGQYFIIILP